MLVRKLLHRDGDNLSTVWHDLLTVLDPESKHYEFTPDSNVAITLEKDPDGCNYHVVLQRTHDSEKVFLKFIAGLNTAKQLYRFISRIALSTYENVQGKDLTLRVSRDITEIDYVKEEEWRT